VIPSSDTKEYQETKRDRHEETDMSHILVITSSPRLASYSTKVAHGLAEQLASREPGSTITIRDLTREPLPHIDDSFAAARGVPADSLTPGQKASLALSDRLLEELFAADIIIIAAAMINFGIPSNLKAYIDYIVRPRVTFNYSAKGPEGLVKGKKVYLVVARGGVYSEGPMQQFNFQDTYLRTALAFIGLNDIELITVEGVGLGPEAADLAVGNALAKVAAIAA
jgi:FMN-dependent NADH-azoreductase